MTYEVIFVSGAGHDREPRKPWEPWVGVGEPAPIEPAATVVRDDPLVEARGAQAHRRVGRPGLPGISGIVHDDVMFSSESVTREVRISVTSEYTADRSRPAENQWFFIYTITIANEGQETIQLLSRHWVITNGSGHVEEVRGPGVVGQQPVLAPGETFTYTSGCPLTTPFGMMEGTYQMVTKGGDSFDAKIAPFTLSEPYTVH